MFPISSFRGREMKKQSVLLAVFAAALLIGSFQILHRLQEIPEPARAEISEESLREIKDVVKPGETISSIFHRYGMNAKELLPLREASAGIHRLRKIVAGHPYAFRLDNDNNVLSFTYQIDDEALLRITRDDPGFLAEKIDIPYEKKIGKFGGSYNFV